MTPADGRHERTIEAAGIRLRAVVDEPGAGSSRARGPRAGKDDVASVLVLHGFTGCAESMESVVRPLVDHCRVVRLELIGHGGSDSPSERAAYTMDACSEQIAEAVDALDLGRPHLLGYSMGGRAAIAAAVAHPDRFASLVLVGATAGIEDPELRRARVAADLALADRIEREGVEAFVDFWMALPIFATQVCLGSERLERARSQRLRNDPVGLANSLRGMGAGAQEPLFGRLARFEAPVLLVVGALDAKFREIALALEARFPVARTRVIEGAGHAAHLEAPEVFAEILSAFLAECRSGP